MKQNDELWRVVASGGLSLLLAEMQAVTNIDTRSRLLDQRDFLRWLRVELSAPTSLAFAVSEDTLGLLWDEIQASAYYAPVLRPQSPPMVTGAGTPGGNTLEADTAPEGYTTMVYSFNGLVFEFVGDIASHSQPGADNYVLVSAQTTDIAIVSLPTSFLPLTS